MKRIIFLLIMIIVLVFTYTKWLIINTLEITNIENEKITINILGQEQEYYFEGGKENE